MIRNIHRRSFAGIVAMLALTGWLAGCGFKGPLYLPPPKPVSTAPATSAPAPAAQISSGLIVLELAS
ncbi:LPS translocon maturation chaperone LptM [Zwartia panacis]|uniref:LPS translocon maturation chaperone LptM n=1 Tax=Zwartia panacis TaxID=2683345 RepID=UPI0025B43959|nr:lipoprotein [Zwartia panacis]MDN4018323.1 lipoprotein [Zwartia panacis]